MWTEHWADADGSADFYRVRPRLALIVTRGSLYSSALPELMSRLELVVRDDSTALFWDAGELLGTHDLGEIAGKLLSSQKANLSTIACCYESPMVGVEVSMMQMSYNISMSMYLSRSAWVELLGEKYVEVSGRKPERPRSYYYSNLSSASSSSLRLSSSASSSSVWRR